MQIFDAYEYSEPIFIMIIITGQIDRQCDRVITLHLSIKSPLGNLIEVISRADSLYS